MNYLYFNIGLKITIGDKIEFTVCESIQINQSVEVLTNTAKVVLPRQFKNAVDIVGKSINISGKSILEFINIGDTIKIELGYDNDLQTEFLGYITEIGADTPLVLECEDEMYNLKTATPITKFIKSGKLEDILKTIIPPKYNIECNGKYGLGTWLIKDRTPFQVLEELKEKIGIRANFKDNKTLSIGQIIDLKPTTIHKFNFSENVRISSDIKFESSKAKKLYITVTSNQSNGKKLSYSTGEKGGNTTTVELDPNINITDLAYWGNQLYLSRAKEGLKGNLDCWCYPRTKAGDLAQIHRPIYKDRHQDGLYFISGVTINVNRSDGIKRTNQIGYKVLKKDNEVLTLPEIKPQ